VIDSAAHRHFVVQTGGGVLKTLAGEVCKPGRDMLVWNDHEPAEIVAKRVGGEVRRVDELSA